MQKFNKEPVEILERIIEQISKKNAFSNESGNTGRIGKPSS